MEEVGREVVNAAFAVHRELGPRLLESVYESCICHELALRKVPFRTQLVLPITYKRLKLESGLTLDLLIGESVIAELKAVRAMEPVFEAQPLSYLKLTGLRLGFLINFNVPLIRDGILRVAP